MGGELFFGTFVIFSSNQGVDQPSSTYAFLELLGRSQMMMPDDELWGVVLICSVSSPRAPRSPGRRKCERRLGSVVGGVSEPGPMMKKVRGLELDDWGPGERGISEGNGLTRLFSMYF